MRSAHVWHLARHQPALSASTSAHAEALSLKSRASCPACAAEAGELALPRELPLTAVLRAALVATKEAAPQKLSGDGPAVHEQSNLSDSRRRNFCPRKLKD